MCTITEKMHQSTFIDDEPRIVFGTIIDGNSYYSYQNR